MRSRNITIRTPHVLLDAFTQRAEKLGYPSLTAYFLGLGQYDLLCQGAHSLTEPWSHLSLTRQDELNERLATLTAQGVGERGQLLAHLIERAKVPDANGISDVLTNLKNDAAGESRPR